MISKEYKIEGFSGMSKLELINAILIEKGNNHAVYALAQNLEKFEGLNSETAKLLTEKGY